MSSVPPATPPRLQGEGFAISVYHKEENAFAYVTGVKDPGEEWRLPNTKEPHRASGRICSPKQVFSEKTALYMVSSLSCSLLAVTNPILRALANWSMQLPRPDSTIS